MTDADLNDEQIEDAPKSLREYAAKLKKQLDATNAENAALREQMASQALRDALSGFKSPSKVERDLRADGVDPLDNAAVSAWLSENGDDYTKVGQAQMSAEMAASRAAFEKLQSAQSSLRQPAEMTKWDLAQSEITPDMDSKQVREVLIKHGL